MNGVVAVMKRELASYFATPIAYVFIVVFLVLSSSFAFYLGNFYERGQADLASFFTFQPWLFLVLAPALSMRLWAEERKTGSIELLLTLPIEIWQAVVGKFLAAWIFAGIAIALTFPMWLTVKYLGDPDNGVILAAYIGSFFTVSGLLAVGSFISATTKNQIVAFLITAFVSLGLLLAGFDLVLNGFSIWAPQPVVDAIASLSFLTHFNNISKGVVDLRDVVYFALLIGAVLYANTILLHVTDR